MNDSRRSTGMEMFVALSREEPFRTVFLFLFGFLPTLASRAVLAAFLAAEILTKLVHPGLLTGTAISFAFSLYFVLGFVVWYKHENY